MLNKYRIRKRQKPKRRIFLSMIKSRFFWFFVFFLILLGGVLYLFFFSGYLDVKNIEISGNKKIGTEEIRGIVEKELSSNFLGILPKNIFLIDLKKLDGDIAGKFPIILKAEINRKLFDSLSVKIEEKTPYAVWCSDTRCLNLDRKGAAFEEGNNTGFIIKKGNDFNLEDNIVSEDVLKNILEIYKSTEEGLKINIKEIVVSDKGKMIAYLEEGWEIYFKEDEKNILEQTTNFKLVLEHKIPPEERRNLEYIDLRFGNKVYYKYKNSSVEENNLIDVKNEN